MGVAETGGGKGEVSPDIPDQVRDGVERADADGVRRGLEGAGPTRGRSPCAGGDPGNGAWLLRTVLDLDWRHRRRRHSDVGPRPSTNQEE